MALLSKTPRKQALLNIFLRVLTIWIHPKPQALMRVAGVLPGRQMKIFMKTQGQTLAVLVHGSRFAVW
jgi:hypothetical protein